jgi:hypothetical protein
MTVREKDGVEAVLFGAEQELLDFKCFRGDRADVAEDDIKKQIHSAFVQKKMKRAQISSDVPPTNVAPQNVREFVKGLETAE